MTVVLATDAAAVAQCHRQTRREAVPADPAPDSSTLLEAGDNTEDGLFTISPVACVGCCSLAPVIMINDETYGRLTPQSLRRILRQYQKAR